MVAHQTLIDLTRDSKDHFTVLPSELLHIIFAYLFPTHDPNLAFKQQQVLPNPGHHSLVYTSATCKRLRAEVNQWCLHYLKQHVAITGYKDRKTVQQQQQRNFLLGHSGLLTSASKHCIFCGKTSRRSAILMNGFRCCTLCDRTQWPGKITKTLAKMEYDLKEYHLFPNRMISQGLPRRAPDLRYGTYITSNVATTMFLREDVRRLAEFIHGDLSEHMRQKQAAKEARARRKTAA